MKKLFFFKNFWIVMTFKVQVCKILTALVTVEVKTFCCTNGWAFYHY